MYDSSSINSNIDKLSNVCAKLLKRIEGASSSDIFAPKDLTNEEKILFLHLGTIGQDMFYDETTKAELPSQLKGNKELETIWYTGIKKSTQKKLYSKAKNILYDLFDKIEREKTTIVNFSTIGMTHTEVAALLHLAQLEGLHVNWDELDHSYCDIHTEWNCKFKLGSKIKQEDVMASMIKKCKKLGIVYEGMAITDKEVLDKITTQNNLNL